MPAGEFSQMRLAAVCQLERFGSFSGCLFSAFRKQRLGIFSVWFLPAIFLRFRWGSAVLTRVFFRVSEALLVL